ncbi:MAG: hypothetical protein ACTJLL_04475 [Anaplasma sp.]
MIKYGNLPLWCMSYDITAGKIEKDRYLLLTPTYHGAEVGEKGYRQLL